MFWNPECQGRNLHCQSQTYIHIELRNEITIRNEVLVRHNLKTATNDGKYNSSLKKYIP